MKVAIIMGSNSDWPKLEPAEAVLKEFGVEVEVCVASAHRTPDKVHEFAAGARGRGVEAILSAAGLAAHLGGVVASYTTLPVIGIPIGGGPLNGMDALLSTVQMPSGIPVATMESLSPPWPSTARKTRPSSPWKLWRASTLN